MGIFKKIWNFVTGKGFQDEEKEQEIKIKEQNIQEQLEQAENLQEPTQETTTQQKEEQITEPTTPQKQETTTQTQTKIIPSKANQETQQATQRFKGSGSITEAQKKLQGNRINQITFTPTNDLSTLKNTYQKLLQKSQISTTDKYGEEDQALIDILIENREKLQHRFSAEIIIITNGGKGSMYIDGILAEHLNSIYDHIQIGATYTSQELKEAMTETYKQLERQYGAIGGNINPPLEKKSTIQSIEINMTFA